MKSAWKHELRNLLPAWVGCILLQLPAIILSRSDDGVPWRFACFSLGCAGLVAYAFRPGNNLTTASMTERVDQIWSARIAALGVALALAVVGFSFFSILFKNPFDYVVALKAVYVSALALCIVPCLTLVTKKPFAAVVFAIMLVFIMKCLGCIVVVLVYGWDASARGYTTTPWTQPNLLVWFFWISTVILALSCYFLGKNRMVGGGLKQRGDFCGRAEIES
jgi:hypothetical protein